MLEQAPHHVQLVVAGKDLLSGLLAGFAVHFYHDLCVVLDDIGDPLGGQNLLPKVVGLEAAWIGRVARTVVPPKVEGEKP